MDPLRVLVIDHDPEVRTSLRTLFERHHYVVDEAPDGDTALLLAAAARPDIVLLDLGLPGDSYVLAAELRARLGGGRAFICALAGYYQPSDPERAHAAAFDAFVLKSSDLDELVSLIGRVTTWRSHGCHKGKGD